MFLPNKKHKLKVFWQLIMLLYDDTRSINKYKKYNKFCEKQHKTVKN